MAEGNHKPYAECRDPVHGFVYLSESEWAIVNCPTFQRLRDIRQLAMAHLVYPGATHPRFEHSLGCLHLSTKIYESVRRNVDKENCPNFAKAFRADENQVARGLSVLRLAALLHDVGHTPFSHSGEDLMPAGANGRRITHEDMSARLIRETEVARLLKDAIDQKAVEEVVAVATGPERTQLEPADRSWYQFLYEMLAGELGSDRMDYLLRDAAHSGQTTGVFDYRKLIDSMTIVPTSEEGLSSCRLGLDEAGWLVGEQMVAARYLMYVSLYFHKTKRIYEKHLERYLQAWLARTYCVPHFPVNNVAEYARLTDSTIWAAIYADAAQSKDQEMRTLARPFVDRTHLRLAWEVILADNELVPTPLAFEKWLKRPAAGRDAEQDLAPQRAWDELIRLLPRHRRISSTWNKARFDNLAKEADTYVREKFGTTKGVVSDQTTHQAAKVFRLGDGIPVAIDGETRYLNELSEIVSGIPERIWRGRIYCEKDIRDEVRKFCKAWLSSHPSTEGGNDGA